MNRLRNIGNKWFFGILGVICVLLVFMPISRADEPWRIRINIPEYKLYLYQGIELYREYLVAVGKKDTPSPAGSFTIINKIHKPTWYPPGRNKKPVPPGPKNPLGKFWLGLNIPGYGIHGNSDPHSIGSPVSLGCFRMHNQDIEQLFGLIPIGTPVEVVYQTVIGQVEANGQAWLRIYPDIYGREKLDAVLGAVFNELHWIFPPHLKALQSLVPLSLRPGKLQVPRSIKIEGDVTGIDGFFWNGAVYVSRNILTAAEAAGIPVTGTPLFDGYLELQYLNYFTALKFYWKEAENTLVVNRALPGNFP